MVIRKKEQNVTIYVPLYGIYNTTAFLDVGQSHVIIIYHHAKNTILCYCYR